MSLASPSKRPQYTPSTQSSRRGTETASKSMSMSRRKGGMQISAASWRASGSSASQRAWCSSTPVVSEPRE
eukprot:scaffold28748_cov64-Phaeocystis_antarctica.AAC.8